MDPAAAATLVLLGFLILVWVATLLDAVRHPRASWEALRRSKVDWVVRLGVFGWVAGLVYLVAVRGELATVRAYVADQPQGG